MRAVTLLLLIFALTDSPIPTPAQSRLEDGTVYRLKAPPHLTGGRFVFTTSDGRFRGAAE